MGRPCKVRNSTHASRERLDELQPYHIQAILMYLDGHTLDEIAERVNRSRHTVYDWLKEKVFCEELERYRQELHDLTWRKIKAKATKAAEKIADKLDSEVPFEALAAAKEILDRAGYKPADKHEITGKDGGPIAYDDARRRVEGKLDRLAATRGTADVPRRVEPRGTERT